MPKFDVAKGLDKKWHGVDEEDAIALRKFRRWYRDLEPGEIFTVSIRTKRDGVQHRRFMKMVRIAFDHWADNAAGERRTYKGIEVAKDIEDFRDELLILAGHSRAVFKLDSTFELKARSISYEECDQDTFDRVYPAVRQVILNQVLTNYTESDLERAIVEEIQRF